MKVALPEFERTGAVVVGDAMLSRYWHGPTDRILSEAPVPVVRVSTIEERPGGAANVAINVASPGVDVRLVGSMGIDDAAHVLSRSLVDISVRCGFVSVPMHPTITKLRVLPHNQQLIRLDSGEGFEGVDPQPLHKRINQALSSIGTLALSDYVKGALVSVQQMIQLARKANVPVLIDPKGIDFERHRGATLLTPNLSESEAVVGRCKTEEETVECGMKLIVDYELSAPLVTRSEQGMSLLQPGKAPLHMSIQVQEVCNATGAGDTVIGVPAAMLAANDSLEEICFFANAAAGVMVGKLGTSTVSPIELENAVCGRADTSFGVITEEELKLAVTAARKCGEKVMTTSSTFDILHAGYVSYLANTYKLGDRLIVAVSSNASTKRLKGDSHPANPFGWRIIVLGALEAADWVVSLEENTPQRLIVGILPDPLVKGGDYEPEEITGSKEVWTSGGEVLMLNFEDSRSTANIIKKIRQDKRGQLKSGSQILSCSRRAY